MCMPTGGQLLCSVLYAFFCLDVEGRGYSVRYSGQCRCQRCCAVFTAVCLLVFLCTVCLLSW